MKESILLILLVFLSSQAAEATSVLERNLVECTLSAQPQFEELVLKRLQTQDGHNNIYEDYVLDFAFGDIYGTEVDILGAHEQVRQRIFTSANAEADGVIAAGRDDYQMITEFEHSRLVINLIYQGQNQNNFPTYTMSIEGQGPAFELVYERFGDLLADSEFYSRYDKPLCVSHFNLDEYITN